MMALVYGGNYPDSDSPQWKEYKGMIGRTPSEALWDISDQFGKIFGTLRNPDCEKCSMLNRICESSCLKKIFGYKPEDKCEEIEKDKNVMEDVILSCMKNEQVREELLKDLEDFKKLVKKRGSYGACFLPDAFGPIVCFMNHRNNDVTSLNPTFKSCIFATEAYCYYILYNMVHFVSPSVF